MRDNDAQSRQSDASDASSSDSEAEPALWLDDKERDVWRSDVSTCGTWASIVVLLRILTLQFRTGHSVTMR
jgi:hypothetical protein